MKYYSEITRRLYNTEEDLRKDEAKIQAKKEEAEAARIKKEEEEKLKKTIRATKAKEVEKALKDANEAQAKAIKLLKEFTKEYGYFHTSYTLKDRDSIDKTDNFNGLIDAFNLFFN